jgi:diacylglycerol kinase (ATP)
MQADDLEEEKLAKRFHELPPGRHLFFARTFKTPAYCVVCESLLWGLVNQGLQCLACRAIVHARCEEEALAKGLGCKAHSTNNPAECSKHHWVRGNLRLLGGIPKCGGCKGMIALPATPIALGKYSRCSMCSVKVHEECMDRLTVSCDGGPLGKAVVLPHELVEVVSEGVISFVPSLAPAKSPLLVFINSRSGAAQGDSVVRSLCSYLNKYQIWDLADGGPNEGLEMFRDVPGLRVMACGGDGTFGWIQSAIDSMKFKMRPLVGHFPLGTGNDMARSLGWGPGYAGENIKRVLFKFLAADVAVLDRWSVTFNGEPHGYTPVMNNYFGVGVDALIAHNFHTAREANPERFANRTLNKMKYISWGATTTLKGLSKAMKLYCDGVEVAVADNCQSIAVLNLPNYAGGQKLWDQTETHEFGKNAYGDGLLEVISLRGAMDVGLAAVGIKPARLGQCKTVRFVLTQPLPVQMDGEPWIQEPCTIEISLLNQVSVLVSSGVAPWAFDMEKALDLTKFFEDEEDDGLL